MFEWDLSRLLRDWYIFNQFFFRSHHLHEMVIGTATFHDIFFLHLSIKERERERERIPRPS